MHAVVVMPQSPHSRAYIETRWAPLLGPIAQFVDWSIDARTPELRLWQRFGGGTYPGVLVLRGLRNPTAFPFYWAFQASKHGDGAPLILINGLADDLSSWAYQLDDFSARYTNYGLDAYVSYVTDKADNGSAVLNNKTNVGIITATAAYTIDAFKIDQTFISDLDDVKSRQIVEMLVGLGEACKLRVTAEGVETPMQAQRLLALGCAYGQGLYFHAAMPAEMVAPLLSLAS